MNMKRTNASIALLFVTAFVVGSFIVGIGAQAQVAATPVACNFGLPSVPAGQPATMTASGGNGSYVWSSPGLVIANPTGSSFTATFNAAGTYAVTVTSAGQSATCSILVTPAVVTSGTPGLPNTGELPG